MPPSGVRVRPDVHAHAPGRPVLGDRVAEGPRARSPSWKRTTCARRSLRGRAWRARRRCRPASASRRRRRRRRRRPARRRGRRRQPPRRASERVRAPPQEHGGAPALRSHRSSSAIGLQLVLVDLLGRARQAQRIVVVARDHVHVEVEDRLPRGGLRTNSAGSPRRSRAVPACAARAAWPPPPRGRGRRRRSRAGSASASRGITSAWPRVHGLMSMNDTVCSSWSTTSAGSSPATILQKMQSSATSRADYSQPTRLKYRQRLKQITAISGEHAPGSRAPSGAPACASKFIP